MHNELCDKLDEIADLIIMATTMKLFYAVDTLGLFVKSMEKEYYGN